MSITVVQTGFNNGNTMPINGVTAGNTLILITNYQNTGGGTNIPGLNDTTGQVWSVLYQPTPASRYGSQPFGLVAYVLSAAEVGSHDISWTMDAAGGVDICNAFAELSGIANPTLDAYNSTVNNGAGATNVSSGSTSSSIANEFLMAAMAYATNPGVANAAITDPPTNFTSIGANQNTLLGPAFEFSYQLATSTGVFNPNWAWTDAGEQVCQGIIVGIYNGVSAPGIPLAGQILM